MKNMIHWILVILLVNPSVGFAKAQRIDSNRELGLGRLELATRLLNMVKAEDVIRFHLKKKPTATRNEVESFLRDLKPEEKRPIRFKRQDDTVYFKYGSLKLKKSGGFALSIQNEGKRKTLTDLEDFKKIKEEVKSLFAEERSKRSAFGLVPEAHALGPGFAVVLLAAAGVSFAVVTLSSMLPGPKNYYDGVSKTVTVTGEALEDLLDSVGKKVEDLKLLVVHEFKCGVNGLSLKVSGKNQRDIKQVDLPYNDAFCLELLPKGKEKSENWHKTDTSHLLPGGPAEKSNRFIPENHDSGEGAR